MLPKLAFSTIMVPSRIKKKKDWEGLERPMGDEGELKYLLMTEGWGWQGAECGGRQSGLFSPCGFFENNPRWQIWFCLQWQLAMAKSVTPLPLDTSTQSPL